MKNFIEELYYGNIDPQARGFTKNSRIKKAYDRELAVLFRITQKA